MKHSELVSFIDLEQIQEDIVEIESEIVELLRDDVGTEFR